jgi:hypothetical protein
MRRTFLSLPATLTVVGLLLLAFTAFRSPDLAESAQAQTVKDKAKEKAKEKVEEKALEHMPKVKAALDALATARTELSEAKHDFGGHKKAALASIDQAIADLEKCYKFKP